MWLVCKSRYYLVIFEITFTIHYIIYHRIRVNLASVNAHKTARARENKMILFYMI